MAYTKKDLREAHQRGLKNPSLRDYIPSFSDALRLSWSQSQAYRDDDCKLVLLSNSQIQDILSCFRLANKAHIWNSDKSEPEWPSIRQYYHDTVACLLMGCNLQDLIDPLNRIANRLDTQGSSSPLEDEIAKWVAYNTGTAEFAEGSQSLLFYDTFGVSPSGTAITAHNPTHNGISSAWSGDGTVSGGKMTTTSVAKVATGLKDFVLSATFQLILGYAGLYCGDNIYFQVGQDILRFIKNGSTVAEMPAQLPAGETHALSVSTNGDRLEGRVGSYILDMTSTGRTGGEFGVYSSSGSNSIDEVRFFG